MLPKMHRLQQNRDPMSLQYYEAAFSQLNLHMEGTHASPHKVAMLLAVMDLIEERFRLTEAVRSDLASERLVQSSPIRTCPRVPGFYG